MKRTFNLFCLVCMLTVVLSLIGAAPTPASARPMQTWSGSMESVPLSLPAGSTEARLLGVWGSSASDVYAVGEWYAGDWHGVPLLYHNDGTGWTEASPAMPDGWTEAYLQGIWGLNASNVYVVGTGADEAGRVLPLVYRQDGSGWTGIGLSMPDGWHHAMLTGVWGSSSSDLYAVGSGLTPGNITNVQPLLYHNDGTGWVAETPAMPEEWIEGYLSEVWGSGAGDVYTAGYGMDAEEKYYPLLYHNDGSGWTRIELALPDGWSDGDLGSVWGTGAGDVYLAGGATNPSGAFAPLLYHNDGNGWTADSPALPAGWTTGSLNSVWGSSSGDVYTIGYGRDPSGNRAPLFYHNDGSGWEEVSLALPEGWSEVRLSEVWGAGAGDVFFVGESLDVNGQPVPLLYQGGADEVVCSPAVTVANNSDSGAGSLRQAVANTCPGGTIDFAPALAGQTISLASVLALPKDVTIDASGLAQNVKVAGAGGADILVVTGPESEPRVILKNLDFLQAAQYGIIHRGGVLEIWNSSFSGSATGIQNEKQLTVANTSFLGNSMDAIVNFGILQVTGSTFTGNRRGIFNERIFDLSYPGEATITNSNFTQSQLGALHNQNGILTVAESRFTGNEAENGGAIMNNGEATVSHSQFTTNNATLYGGAIYNVSNLTVTASTFLMNTAASQGGGIYNVGGLELNESTFDGNSTSSMGGGMFAGMQVLVTNSTFTNNSAMIGGGIYFDSNESLVSTLTNNTIAGNMHGGLVIDKGALELFNNILADGVAGSNCYIWGPATVTGDHNLIETDPSWSMNCDADLTADPKLGPLADNGGPTQTMALLPGSPAIDAGSDAICPETDQRGEARPLGPHCDLGAYEVEQLDTTQPTVVSIVRADPNPTRAAYVDFTVTFSEGVTGVEARDFALKTLGGIRGAAITEVSGSGSVYIVTVKTGKGSGFLRLDVPLRATVTDLAGNPLGSLPFRKSEVYKVIGQRR